MKKLNAHRLLISWIIFLSGMSAVFLYMNSVRIHTTTNFITHQNTIIILMLSVAVALSSALNLASIYLTFKNRLAKKSVLKLIFLNTSLLFLQCVCFLGILVLTGIM